jgi:hypothetical protein
MKPKHKNGQCEFDCPYLKPCGKSNDGYEIDAGCTLLDIRLVWDDWLIAECETNHALKQHNKGE